MSLRIKTLFVFQWIVLFYFSVSGFSFESTFLPRYCANPNGCSADTKKYLEKLSLSCEAEKQALNCEGLAKEHPEWKPMMRECGLAALCQQRRDIEGSLSAACLEGFKNAAVDLGVSVKDMALDLGGFIDASWESMKKNIEMRQAFLRECEKSLLCKRDLVKDHPQFKSLSDEELSSRSAEFLFAQGGALKGASRQPPRSSGNSPLALSAEQSEKWMRLAGAVGDSVKTQYSRYACFHPIAQKELECYALGNLVDPTLVAGYFMKGARAVRVIGKILAKGESPLLRRATDVTTAAEKTGKFVVLTPKASDLVSFSSKAISNPPAGIKILRSTNSEGQSTLYFQSREYLTNGARGVSTREFQLDSLTGAIDANYPAGRELFEKLVKAKSSEGHLAFIDVGSLGAVNKTFKAGTEAGDRYIKAVAEKIIKVGEGRITLARTGGDEFALLINEKDGKKVQELLAEIRDQIRKDHDGDAKKVFREEKIVRAEAYRQNPSSARAQDLEDLATIQQPDISVGAVQIGGRDSLSDLMKSAEEQAKGMKIDTALQFGRSGEKYGSDAAPRSVPDPRFRAPVREPVASSSWKQRNSTDLSSLETQLPEIRWARVEEVKKIGDTSIGKYRDETGREAFRVEKFVVNSKTQQKQLVTHEIPVRGNTGLLDGGHPESQKLILEHFLSNPQGTLIMPKVTSLRYLNYFENGTKAGDEMLEAVAEVVKRQTRNSDLSFKMGGADFLMSVDQTAAKEFGRVQRRINDEIMKNDRVKAILQQERSTLQHKLSDARTQKDLKLIRSLEEKIEKLKNFSPNIEVEVIQRSEVSSNPSFEEIYKKFNQKFENPRR